MREEATHQAHESLNYVLPHNQCFALLSGCVSIVQGQKWYLSKAYSFYSHTIMGSCTSHEEQLFSSLEWQELLDYVITKEMEEGTAETLRRPPGVAVLSLKDWHIVCSALSGNTLELQGVVSMCAEMIRKGLAEGYHGVGGRVTQRFPVLCCAVPLVVYILAWWQGLVPRDELRTYLDELEQYASLLEQAVRDAEEMEKSSESEEEEEEEMGAAAPVPLSRRQRLFGAVQSGLGSIRRRLPRGRRGAAAKQVAPADSHAFLVCAMVLCRQGCLGQEKPGEGLESKECATALANIWLTAGGSVLFGVMGAVIHAIFAIKAPYYPQTVERSIRRLQRLYETCQLYQLEWQRKMNAEPAEQRNPAIVPDQQLRAVACSQLLSNLYADLMQRQLSNQASNLSQSQKVLQEMHQLGKDRDAAVNSISSASSFSSRWAACRSQYIGQHHIWQALRSHFKNAHAFHAEKPTVIVLFGPSGLGKSELAKRLAAGLHGLQESQLEPSGKLVHIHMPSFCTKDSIYSLVDPPAAHVGDGMLLSAILQHPDAVVVLDEFEKSTIAPVQHLWLSAFQKNGVLRSLKNASRSVSTAHTTFVLTCNLADTLIQDAAGEYLNGTAQEQEALRAAFTRACRDACRDLFGEPFVNRVDFFFPVVPYTTEERHRFVLLLLERLLSPQKAKGRHVAVTSECVEALVSQLTTFHAATVEEAVKPLLVTMMQRRWRRAVLTAVAGIKEAQPRLVLVPADQQDEEEGVPSSDTEEDLSVSEAVEEGAVGELLRDRHGALLCWDQLDGGKAWLSVWFSESDEHAASSQGLRPTLLSQRQGSTTPKPPDGAFKHRATTSGAANGTGSTPSAELRMIKEMNVEKDVLMSTELEKEVARLLDVVREKDLEIDSLKKKDKLMTKALGVVTLALLFSSLLMSVFLGVKMTLIFYAVVTVALVVLLEVPLKLLWDALKALYSILGPFRFFFLMGLLLPLLLWTARSTDREWVRTTATSPWLLLCSFPPEFVPFLKGFSAAGDEGDLQMKSPKVDRSSIPSTFFYFLTYFVPVGETESLTMDSGSSDSDGEFHQFKVAVVGNGAVGKSSIIRRLCESGFKESYKQTLGLDFYTKKITLPNSATAVSLQVWDIGGQQLGGKMIDHYLSNSNAICCVYDVTNIASLRDVEEWKECITRVFKGKTLPKMILVGNKIDLPHRQVSDGMHEEVANTYGMDAYLVAAISGEKINSMFTKIAADLVGVQVADTDLEWGDHVAVTVQPGQWILFGHVRKNMEIQSFSFPFIRHNKYTQIDYPNLSSNMEGWRSECSTFLYIANFSCSFPLAQHMKTLDDFLASSSSDDDDVVHREIDRTRGPNSVSIPTAAQHRSSVPASPVDRSFTASRRSAQEEMRDKMKKFLGEAAVAQSQEIAAAAVASPTSAIPTSNVTNTAVSSNSNSRHGFSSERVAGTAQQGSQPTTAASTSPQPTMSPAYEPIEVTLMDRGTQTVSTVSVQTEPLPPPAELLASGPRDACVGHGAGAVYGNAPGLDYVRGVGRPTYGIDGRPYRHLMDDLDASYSEGARRLRSQLSVLQSNIDMLISRYNLPPPPGFEL
eukprot:gene5910-4225_t